MKTILSIIIFVIFPIVHLSAQEHQHSHARNEIGISPGVTYSPSHKIWGGGIHAHYFRTLGEHSPWSLGGSAEFVTSHGSHWTLSLGSKYEIIDRLNLTVMPGITFFQHDEDGHNHSSHTDEDHHPKNAQFSIHFELGYDLIHTKNFHLGPAIDYSWSKHDTHFMLGVHCAYAF